jgi:hypothetical protein
MHHGCSDNTGIFAMKQREARITVEMPVETKTELEMWAAEEGGCSIGSLMRRIIKRSLQERRGAGLSGEAA